MFSTPRTSSRNHFSASGSTTAVQHLGDLGVEAELVDLVVAAEAAAQAAERASRPSPPSRCPSDARLAKAATTASGSSRVDSGARRPGRRPRARRAGARAGRRGCRRLRRARPASCGAGARPSSRRPSAAAAASAAAFVAAAVACAAFAARPSSRRTRPSWRRLLRGGFARPPSAALRADAAFLAAALASACRRDRRPASAQPPTATSRGCRARRVPPDADGLAVVVHRVIPHDVQQMPGRSVSANSSKVSARRVPGTRSRRCRAAPWCRPRGRRSAAGAGRAGCPSPWPAPSGAAPSRSPAAAAATAGGRVDRAAWLSSTTPSPAALNVPGRSCTTAAIEMISRASSGCRNCRRGSKPSTDGSTGLRK